MRERVGRSPRALSFCPYLAFIILPAPQLICATRKSKLRCITKASSPKAIGPLHTVFIVEDHPIFGAGLAALIAKTGNMTVCGTAARGRDALEAVIQLKPSLVIVDVRLPDQNGLRLIPSILAASPGTRIVVISVCDDRVYARSALRAGAHGYVMKHQPPAQMIEAIENALRGKVYVSHRVAQQIAAETKLPRGFEDPLDTLTRRELQVLDGIGNGKTTPQIARILGLSVKTVETHRGALKRKLGIPDSRDLLRYAVRFAADPDWKNRNFPE